MKTFLNIMKFVAVLAAIAGVVYIVAVYGDRIVAWARKVLRSEKNYYNEDEYCVDDMDSTGDSDFAE